MPIQVLRDVALGDMIARFVHAEDAPRRPGLVILPARRLADAVPPREHLTGLHITQLPAAWQPMRAWGVDPLVHVALREDPRPNGFTQGRSLRNAPATETLLLESQEVLREAAGTRVLTRLSSTNGLNVLHELIHGDGDRMLRVRTILGNAGTAPLTLQLLTSFSLGGITPFAPDDAPGRLWVHRFRSTWSAEGRPVCERAEDLHLEPSWCAYGVRCERFGVAGSHPISGWFPTVGIEDRTAGVTWAAQVAASGSWQLELYRRQDQLAVSGGLADVELGHWEKLLPPGASFAAPEAWITVADGPAATVWPRLQDGYRAAHAAAPESERDLPPVFNEWCTSWGNPTHDNLIAIADRLRGSGVRYMVIDDGWAERPGAGIQQNGDWIVNGRAFPGGLKATCDAIRSRGLIPGIWFEFEVCNSGSKAWEQTDHLLRQNGRTLQVGNRRFWDFRDPWVHAYLAEKVIRLLRDNGFGYLKVDYNDTIGFGCDGAESPGEALRQHLDGVLAFFERVRAEVPGIVIENCASGGHRETIPFVQATGMSSFSDAHETQNIPIIAANLLPLIPARKSQIWAVLHAADTARRELYSLAATFLGRMCLSGEIHALSEPQWELAREAVDLHRAVVGIIAEGAQVRHGATGPSYNHPEGWQAVTFTSEDSCLAVLHAFANPPGGSLVVPLPAGRWSVVRGLNETASAPPHVAPQGLVWTAPGEFSGSVALLRRA